MCAAQAPSDSHTAAEKVASRTYFAFVHTICSHCMVCSSCCLVVVVNRSSFSRVTPAYLCSSLFTRDCQQTLFLLFRPLYPLSLPCPCNLGKSAQYSLFISLSSSPHILSSPCLPPLLFSLFSSSPSSPLLPLHSLTPSSPSLSHPLLFFLTLSPPLLPLHFSTFSFSSSFLHLHHSPLSHSLSLSLPPPTFPATCLWCWLLAQCWRLTKRDTCSINAKRAWRTF